MNGDAIIQIGEPGARAPGPRDDLAPDQRLALLRAWLGRFRRVLVAYSGGVPYTPLMESYREEKPQDFKVIEKYLEDHIATLWRVLQAFDGAGLPGGS